MKCLLAIVCLLGCSGLARAEIWPVYSVDELAREADLIVSGQLTGENALDVTAVHYHKQGLAVAQGATLNFTMLQRSDAQQVGDEKVELTDEAILFIDTDGRGYRVRGNGMMRAGRDGGVWGYHQPTNPGHYFLTPLAKFDSLDAVIERAAVVRVEYARERAERLKAYLAAESPDPATLRWLAMRLNLGHDDIAEAALAAVANDPKQVDRVAALFEEAGRPEAAIYLHDLYVLTHDPILLATMLNMNLTHMAESFARSARDANAADRDVIGSLHGLWAMSENQPGMRHKIAQRVLAVELDEAKDPPARYIELLREINDPRALRRLQRFEAD